MRRTDCGKWKPGGQMGARVVSMGANHGYRETPIAGRQGFVQRTYVEGGVHYSRVYRSYEYNNIHYERYVPSVVYSRRFYAWEVHPWRAPVVYQWGWQAQPWYGYYGGYFTPEPRYADAAMLLTDYIIAENLRTAYEARQESCANCVAPAGNDFAQSAPDSAPAAPISEQEKTQLADEVRQELTSAENGAGAPASADATPEALDPKIQTFLVASNIFLDAGDSTCSLTPGDMLFRVDTTVTEGKVNVRVEDSQKGDCPANTVSQLDVATLEEMHNRFRETLDQGQQVAAANEGKGGLPAGPPAGATSFAEGQTTDDSDQVRSDLVAQQQMADQTEAQAQQEANQQLQPAVYTGGAMLNTASQPAPAASPVSMIGPGQTIAQVVSIAGQPRVVKAFPPVLKVYVYQGYAVVFQNGVVTSVKDGTAK